MLRNVDRLIESRGPVLIDAPKGARFWSDRRAVTAVEYAIIVGVMVAALVISVPSIGSNLTNIFTSVAAPL